MSLVQHAQTELKLSGFFDEDSDYGGMVGDAVMELIEVFAKQEHSGMSAGIVASLFNKLANYEPLQGITGRDEEWVEAFNDKNGQPVYQNKRCSAVFKHSDGRATYNDALVKRGQNGACWTGGPLYLTREDAINDINKIQVEVKKFPFTPKTFYVDVLEEEIAKDDWIMWIKDPSQLDEVLQYYKKST
jgi:hypothetical protein